MFDVMKSIKALEDDIKDTKKQIEKLQSRLNLLEDMLAKLIDSNFGDENAESYRRIKKRSAIPTTVAASEECIKQQGHPLNLDELYQGVKKLGAKTSKQSLSATLARYAREGRVFISPERGIYDLIERNEKASK